MTVVSCSSSFQNWGLDAVSASVVVWLFSMISGNVPETILVSGCLVGVLISLGNMAKGSMFVQLSELN